MIKLEDMEMLLDAYNKLDEEGKRKAMELMGSIYNQKADNNYSDGKNN